MAEALTNGIAQATGTRVIVSVAARDTSGANRATILDSSDSAQRLVEALIEAGCDSARVQAFSGHEVRVGIELSPTVALYDTDGGIIAAALAEAGAQPLSAPVVAPLQPGSEPIEPTPAPAEPQPPAAPHSNFHLRADRVVFACLWVVSLAVLLVSLMVSLSRSEPREFVPGAPASGNIAPSAQIKALDASLAPLSNTSRPLCSVAGSNGCRCSNFVTQEDAQAFYSQHPPRAGHIADTDGDGVFCEWLRPALPAP